MSKAALTCVCAAPTHLPLQDETQAKLDYVLALTPADFLERRLQTLVFKLGLAKSIHHARVLIRQRHIRVGKQIVNVASFLVRVESQKHIDFALNSPFGGGRPGRNKRKALKVRPHYPPPPPAHQTVAPTRHPLPPTAWSRGCGVQGRIILSGWPGGC